MPSLLPVDGMDGVDLVDRILPLHVVHFIHKVLSATIIAQPGRKGRPDKLLAC
jgi:hypothetical protein